MWKSGSPCGEAILNGVSSDSAAVEVGGGPWAQPWTAGPATFQVTTGLRPLYRKKIPLSVWRQVRDLVSTASL
jgi:hypothetical protein